MFITIKNTNNDNDNKINILIKKMQFCKKYLTNIYINSIKMVNKIHLKSKNCESNESNKFKLSNILKPNFKIIKLKNIVSKITKNFCKRLIL